MNVSLRSSEKKVGSLSQEILKLKSAKQQLEEEHTRQRKSLQQQLTKTNTQRTEIQKLNGKIETLTQKNEVSCLNTFCVHICFTFYLKYVTLLVLS